MLSHFLKILKKKGVRIGQVGTVIEVLEQNVFEVEFNDNNGYTYAVLVLRSDQLMPLRYSPQAA